MREENERLRWQSKAILLLVAPWTAIAVVLQNRWWIMQMPVVAWTTLGISTAFGLVVWRLRAGTLAAAATGAAICACLMFSSAAFPYQWSWLHGALPPLLMVFLLTFAATKAGKAKKEQLGTGEGRRGRNAAQVAANLGIAALIAQPGTLTALPHLPVKIWSGLEWASFLPLIAGWLTVAALAEAAADRSSEASRVSSPLCAALNVGRMGVSRWQALQRESWLPPSWRRQALLPLDKIGMEEVFGCGLGSPLQLQSSGCSSTACSERLSSAAAG